MEEENKPHQVPLEQLEQVKQMIETAADALAHAKKLLAEMENSKEGENKYDLTGAGDLSSTEPAEENSQENGRIIEGEFDGLDMIGPDGKQYSVPQNYASKSKLVEGDRLKLTIDENGSFVYKQIGPVDRKRIIGILTQNGDSEEFRVLGQGKSYKVLLASVTYFKGEVGDEVVILAPKEKEAKWAAVENIIKKARKMTVGQDTEYSNPELEDQEVLPGENPENNHDAPKVNEFSQAAEEIDKIEEI